MAQESYNIENDIIDKCHFIFKKHISAEKEFFKEVTSLKFKISNFEPITIECDAFPTKEQFSKLSELIQKAVARKEITVVGKTKTYSAENSSHDPAFSPVDSEPNQKLIHDGKDISELADKISEVHISPVEKAEKNYTSNEGSNLSSKDKVVKKKEKMSENKIKANRKEASKDEIAINKKSQILSPSKFTAEQLSFETKADTESKEAQIICKTTQMTKKSKSVPDENEMKNSESQEDSESSISSDNQELKSEHQHRKNHKHESRERKIRNPKKSKSESKNRQNDGHEIKNNSSSNEDFSSPETKHEKPVANKTLTLSSKGEKIIKSTSKVENLEKIKNVTQTFKSEGSKQYSEKQKLGTKKFDDQSEISVETHGESKKLKNSKSKHEPMDVSDISDPETPASSSQCNTANKNEDSPSSSEDKEDSDTEAEVSYMIDEASFKAAELYFKGTKKSSFFEDAKKINNAYEVIISRTDTKLMDFIIKIKDFKMLKITVSEKADLIIQELKANFPKLVIYLDQNIIYITGPQSLAHQARGRVISLMGNRDDELTWSATKHEDIADENIRRKHEEKVTEDSRTKEKPHIDSKDDKTVIKILPNKLTSLSKRGSSDKVNTTGGDSPKESSFNEHTFYKERTESEASNSKGVLKHDELRNRPMRAVENYGALGESGNKCRIERQSSCHSVFTGNVKVTICKEDITMLSVECIVNSAYKNLKHQYGVARCIAKAAGERLEKECEQHIKNNGLVNVTNIVVTNAGNLKAKKVIHAVGPLWEDFNKLEKFQSDLRKTVLRCLIEASKMNMSSIALPPISYFIQKVPKEKCAESYLKAVKSFNNMMKELNLSSIREIYIVDVNDEMFRSISECFEKLWEKDMDSLCYKEDFIFAKRIAEEKLVQHNVKHSPVVRSNSRSRTGASPKFIERKKEYTIGRARLLVTTKHAMDFKSDAVVVFGDLFDALSTFPGFDVGKMRKAEGGKKNKKFESYISKPSGKQPKDVCKININHFNEESLSEAFQTLKELFSPSTSAVTIVITSRILYPEKNILSSNSYPKPKAVSSFSQFVYKYVEEMAEGHTPSTVTVTSCEEAMPNILKVFDYEEAKKQKTAYGVSSSVDIDCPICTDSTRSTKLTKCCKKSICMVCEIKSKRCPFCMEPFGIFTGDQPDGRMDVKYREFMHAPGYEQVGVYEITYDFPSGQQKADHPNPGRFYSAVTRTAFLPASQEGFDVLKRLRIAFLRRLVFTIGTSATTGNSGVITWNDIHHKTKLDSGSHCYPDANYLKNVQVELKSKGVTEDSFTDEEKRKLFIFSDKVSKDGFFLDFRY